MKYAICGTMLVPLKTRGGAKTMANPELKWQALGEDSLPVLYDALSKLFERPVLLWSYGSNEFAPTIFQPGAPSMDDRGALHITGLVTDFVIPLSTYYVDEPRNNLLVYFAIADGGIVFVRIAQYLEETVYSFSANDS